MLVLFIVAKRRRIMKKNEIVLFETADNEVSLQVQDETVWLTHSTRSYSREDTNPYDRFLQS